MARIDPLTGAGSPLSRAADEDFEADRLPREHPRWVRDAVAVSQRARAVLGRMRPVVMRIFTFWDHASRSITFGRGTLSVNASGCYRLD